jgi:uncharacterized protein (TIGR02598 family)
MVFFYPVKPKWLVAVFIRLLLPFPLIVSFPCAGFHEKHGPSLLFRYQSLFQMTHPHFSCPKDVQSAQSRLGQPVGLRRAGFSLVEVTLAIGVVAFAFVALFALLPGGMTTFRRTIELGVCSQIAQQVISDLQQTEFARLVGSGTVVSNGGQSFRWPAMGDSRLRYFDEAGNEVLVSPEAARNPDQLSPAQKMKISYWVNARVMPNAPMPGSKGKVRYAEDTALVTVQVAFNPSGQAISFYADSGGASGGGGVGRSNLFVPKTGVSVLTYPTVIARGL